MRGAGKGWGMIPAERRPHMRFLWLLRLGWWLAVLAFVIYAGITAMAAYFRAADAVESAIDTATRWDRLQRGTASGVANYTDSIREEIVAKARKQGVPLDERKMGVSQSGRTIVVHVRWAQPVLTVSDETVVAVPLSLSRRFDIQ